MASSPWEPTIRSYMIHVPERDPTKAATRMHQAILCHLPIRQAHEELREVDNLQGIYPLKDEWVFGCSLKTRLADQTKAQQLKWLWSKDSMNSAINQRLVEQTQEINIKLEGSGGSTLGDTLRKQYLSSSDE